MKAHVVAVGLQMFLMLEPGQCFGWGPLSVVVRLWFL